MARDGLTRMDVDTRWAYHRKSRRLQRLYPKSWPTYYAAYMALLGEVWFTKSRSITLEDAWLPALPCTLAQATDALVAAGYLGADGRVPADSYDEWVEPALSRIEARSRLGKEAAEKRWHGETGGGASGPHSIGNADASPRQSNAQSNGYAPRQPASQPTTPADESSSQAPTAVPARRAPAEQQPRLTREQLDAWSGFDAPEWQPFKAAWLARGLLHPPSGSADDDDTSQRGLLWQVADARPRSLAEWVTEAKGRTARQVLDHVLERWHEVREASEETDSQQQAEGPANRNGRGSMRSSADVLEDLDFGQPPPAGAIPATDPSS